MPKGYLLLIAAVLFETVGTSALQASHQFSRLWPSGPPPQSRPRASVWPPATLAPSPSNAYASHSGFQGELARKLAWPYTECAHAVHKLKLEIAISVGSGASQVSCLLPLIATVD